MNIATNNNIKKVLFLLCITLNFTTSLYSSARIEIIETNTTLPSLHPDNWKNNYDILSLLKFSTIQKMIPMNDFLATKNQKARFNSPVFFIEFENGLQAVFKPNDRGNSYFEEVAYNISCYLGFPYVPPTIMREINGTLGSLQLFVPITYLEPYENIFARLNANDLNNLKLFYFIFGQWDCYPDNLLLWQDPHTDMVYPIAIDNNGMQMIQKAEYKSRPFVALRYSKKINSTDFDQAFPFHSAITIDDMSEKHIRTVFENMMPIGFFKHFPYHCTRYTYILYQNYLWRQFYTDSNDFLIPYAEQCSTETYQALQKLDKEVLLEIYKKALPYIRKGGTHAKCNKTISNEYFNDIIDRRDQALSYLTTRGNII